MADLHRVPREPRGQHVPVTTAAVASAVRPTPQAALVALQRTAGNHAAAGLIQRQAASADDPSAPAPPAPVRLPPRLRVRIVAHSSPRWRSAASARAADEANLALSRQRAESVRKEVEASLLAAVGPDAQIDFNVEHQDDADTGRSSIDVGSEGRGSTETLRQAKGDRRSDDAWYRRVDVSVEQVSRQEEYAGVSLPPSTTKSAKLTTRWWVDVKVVGQGTLGASAAVIQMEIMNSDTKRKGIASVFAGGGGTPGVSAAMSVGGDPVSFWTEEPMGFADFEGVWVRLTSVGVGLIFIGWEKALLSFVGLGPLAQELDVGGFQVGAQLKLGGSVVSGPIRWDGGPPSDVYDEPGPTHDWAPYETADVSGDGHVSFFDTGVGTLADDERDELRAFARRVGASFAGEVP